MLQLDSDSGLVEVEAGILISEVNEILAKNGLGLSVLVEVSALSTFLPHYLSHHFSTIPFTLPISLSIYYYLYIYISYHYLFQYSSQSQTLSSHLLSHNLFRTHSASHTVSITIVHPYSPHTDKALQELSVWLEQCRPEYMELE